MFKYRRESIRDTFIAVAPTFLALIFLVNIGQISALKTLKRFWVPEASKTADWRSKIGDKKFRSI